MSRQTWRTAQLALPHRRRARRRRTTAGPSTSRLVGDELWWTEPRPAEGGRTRAGPARPTATVESVLPAPWNVRSRVIEYGGRPWAADRADGDRSSCSSTSPTSGCTPSPRAATPRPAHPAAGRRRAALGRAGAAPGGRRGLVRAGGFTGDAADRRRRVAGGRAAGRLGRRGPGRRTDPRRPTGTVPGLARRCRPTGCEAAWIAWDHPRDAVGRHRAAGRRRSASDGTLGPPRTLAGGPEESVRPVLLARCHRRLARSSATPPAGGTCTGSTVTDRTGRRPLPAAGGVRRPAVEVGARWFAAAGRRADPRPARLRRLPASASSTRERRARPRSQAPHDGVGRPPRAPRQTGSSASPPARSSPYELVELDLAPARPDGAAPAAAPRLPAYYLSEPQRRTFTGAGRPRGPRRGLPAAPPRPRRRRGPPAAVPGVGPRRPHQPLPAGLDLEIAYFTSRGHRRRRGQLRRLHRLRPRLPRAAARAVGRGRRRGLRGRGARPGRRGHRRPGAAGDPRRQRRRLDVRVPRWPPRDVYACATIRYPILDLTGWRTGETHDFESRYLESLVGPLAGGQGPLPRALPGQPHRPDQPRRSCCSRAWTT